MKVLIYGLNFAPELTGVGKYTGEMAEWLAARGHSVRVVTSYPYYPQWRVAPGYRSAWYSRESWRGVEVIRCPLWIPRKPSGASRMLHLASFALSGLPAVIAQAFWRPDLVVTVEPTMLCAPAALTVGRMSRAATWLHVQDLEIDAAFGLGMLKGRVARALALAWERRSLKRFGRVSTISRRMLSRLAEKGVEPDRLWLLPNWADLESQASDDGTSALRRELDIPPEAVVALYSGAMGNKQGLEILAEAANRLRESIDLYFVFCGNGAGREALETGCHGLDNVRFVDLQPVERLGDLLAMADVHLLPQRADAADLVMPSKLTGMLASGRPVVATCARGTELWEVLQGVGLATAPGDAGEFAQAIGLLSGDEDMRHSLGAEAARYAAESLGKDVVLGSFEAEMARVTAV